MNEEKQRREEDLVLKVALVGDSMCGKTSFMTAFVEGKCSLDAVDFYRWGFMEKKVKVGKQFVTFSLWEAAGKRNLQTTFPLAVQDAAVILFFFDLTRLDTLANIKAWYQECRRHNKTTNRVLVGAKFDLFYETSKEEEAAGGGGGEGDQERKAEAELTESKAKVLAQARRYAKAMKCPLVFTSINPKINVTTTMKVALRLACGLSLADIETKTNDHSPLVEFNPPIARAPRSLKEQCVRYVRRTWSEAGGGEAEGRERWDLAMLPLDLQELFVAKKT